MPGNEKKWDIAAERDLCVAVIAGNQDTERPRHNWPKIHNFMDKLGYGFSKEAISQHFTKVIMKDFKNRHGNTPAASTPKKTSVSTPKKATPSSSKKRVHVDDDDDSEVDRKPKKPKQPATPNSDESPVKSEKQRSKRERSATIQDNEAGFQEWLARTTD